MDPSENRPDGSEAPQPLARGSATSAATPAVEGPGEPTGRLVPVAPGLRLWVRDYAGPEGPPWVLLHGLGITGATWRRIAPRLSSARRVVVPDLPGFGASDKPRRLDASVPGLARSILGLLDALGLARAVLVGHSLGGATALVAALLEPGRVAGLALLGSAAYRQALPPAIRLAQLPLAAWGLRLLPRRLLALGYRDAYHLWRPEHEQTVDEYIRALRSPGGPEAYARTCRAIRFPDLEPYSRRIPEVAAPTLILQGAQDRVVPPEVGRRLHREIASSALRRLENVGHMPQEEVPEQVVDTLLGWLGQIESGIAKEG